MKTAGNTVSEIVPVHAVRFKVLTVMLHINIIENKTAPPPRKLDKGLILIVENIWNGQHHWRRYVKDCRRELLVERLNDLRVRNRANLGEVGGVFKNGMHQTYTVCGGATTVA